MHFVDNTKHNFVYVFVLLQLKRVEAIAEQLGYKRVGFIFAVNSKERGDAYTISADELMLMAKLQVRILQ